MSEGLRIITAIYIRVQYIYCETTTPSVQYESPLKSDGGEIPAAAHPNIFAHLGEEYSLKKSL